MKQLLTVATIAAISMFYAGCGSSENYPQQKIGVVKDVNVVPTSSNELIKTQIKTERKFFVVEQIPQLTIGKQLVAKVDGSRLVEIQDDAGRWFKVR